MRVTSSARWRTVSTSWSVTPPSNSRAVRRVETWSRRRVVHVEPDPTRVEERQLVAVADADQGARAAALDVLEALAERRSGRHHLERPDQSGLLSTLKLGDFVPDCVRLHRDPWYAKD